MEDGEQKLNEVKDLIRSLLLSTKEGTNARDFMRDYSMVACTSLDFRALGFKSLDALLRSMPDVVRVRSNFNGELEYHGVADESTAHIQKMVQAQRSGKKRKKLIHPKKMQSFFGHGGSSSLQERHWPSYFGKRPPLNTKKTPSWRPPPSRGGGRGGFHSRPPQRGRGSDRSDSSSPPVSNTQDFKKNVPPRFQKQRPIAVVTPSSAAGRSSGHSPARGSSSQDGLEEDLSPQKLQQIKHRVHKLLESRPNGVWITRLPSMYEEKFGTAPPNLMELVHEWRDIIHVEESQSKSCILFAKPPKEARTSDTQSSLTRSSSSSSSSSNSSAATSWVAPVKSTNRPSPVPIPPSPWITWKDVRVARGRLPELGIRMQVYTIFIVSLNDFYVYPASFDTSSMSSLLAKTASKCPSAKASDLRRNMFCTACYSADQQWYRACISDLPYKEANVRFIDFGNREKVPYGMLRPLPPEASHPPAQAIHCCLARVLPKNEQWTDAAVQFFADQVQDCELDMVVQDHGNDDTAFVDLFCGKNMCINDQMVLKGFADYISTEDEDEDDCEPPPLTFPQDRFIPVYVCCLNPEKKILYIRLVGDEYSDKLDELSGLLEESYNSRPPMTLEELEVSMVCIMKEESEDADSCNYHRCRVISKEDQGLVLCASLDHGDSSLVHPSNLRFLDAETNKSLPYQATPCVLYGVDLNEEAIPILYDLVVGKSLIGDNAGLEGQDENEPLCLVLYDTEGDEQSINELVKNCMSATRGSPDRTVSQDPDLASLKITVNVDDQSRQVANPAPPAETKPLYSWSMDQLRKNEETSITATSASRATGGATGVRTTGRATGSTAGDSTDAAVSRTTGATGSGDARALQAKPRVGKQWNPEPYFLRPIPAKCQLPQTTHGQVGELSVDVIVIRSDDPSNFVVIQCQDVQELDDMMAALQSHFSDRKTKVIHLDMEDVRVGVLYGVCVENLWYRAVVEKIETLGISVYLCDYGEYHLVPIDLIRPLLNKFWRPNQFAIKCRLHDVQPSVGQIWSKEAREAFQDLTKDNKMVYAIRFTEILDPERNIVQLIDTSDGDDDIVIADRLLQLGFAKRAGKDHQ